MFSLTNTDNTSFSLFEEEKNSMLPISSDEAVAFLLPKHYSGRIPNIVKAFGWYQKGELKAVCTFGKPASPQLCWCCGKENQDSVYELNRLCRTEDLKGQLSTFVAWCLRELKPLNWIVVSYSDTAMHHHGYIYQACNFKYLGLTKERTDFYTPNGTHSRHYDKNNNSGLRKVRSSKHKYIYFACDNRQKKYFMSKMVDVIQPYPKGDNENYKLGFVLKDKIVKDNRLTKIAR